VHGVPSNLDLSPFISARLDRIDLGLHMLYFRFDADGATPFIGVEGAWELRDRENHLIDHSISDTELLSDRDAYHVHVLLGHVVERAEIAPPRSFTLHFDSGHRLVVYDNSRQWESFHIEPGGIHI
jgi:hypothetical protein